LIPKIKENMKMKHFVCYGILFLGMAFFIPGLSAGEPSSDDLCKAAQNPMADLVSIPVQNNTNFGDGPLEETQNITNIGRLFLLI
jgi:hypothetical protein